MNSTFNSPYPAGSIYDQLYQKYHDSGFSAQYFLQYNAPQCFSSLIGILLNLSFIYVSIKSSPFNIFITFESVASILYAAGYLAGDWLPLSGQNVAPVEICILLRLPALLGALMQTAMMVFIGLERFICLCFPLFYRNILLAWKTVYIRFVLFFVVSFAVVMTIVIFSNTIGPNYYYLCNFADFLNEDGRKYTFRGIMFAQILALSFYAIILFLMIKARIQRVKLMDIKNMQILRSLNVIMGIIIFGWLINASSPIYVPLLQISQSDWQKISTFTSSINILASACNGPVLFVLSQEYRNCYQSVLPWLSKRNQSQTTTTPVHVIHR